MIKSSFLFKHEAYQHRNGTQLTFDCRFLMLILHKHKNEHKRWLICGNLSHISNKKSIMRPMQLNKFRVPVFIFQTVAGVSFFFLRLFFVRRCAHFLIQTSKEKRRKEINSVSFFAFKSSIHYCVTLTQSHCNLTLSLLKIARPAQWNSERKRVRSDTKIQWKNNPFSVCVCEFTNVSQQKGKVAESHPSVNK